MNRTTLALIAALIAACLLSGCESMGKTWDDTWIATKGYYKEYVNPDPAVDLAKIDYSSSEEKLAELFTPVDRPMGELGRYLNRKDDFPGEKWLDELFARFPWINGCMVSTLEGEVVLARPEASLKPRNVQPFLDMGADLGDRRLRSYVDMTPMGPEVYLATAMFKANELIGFISVHFDPRSLIKLSPSPDELLVLTPEVVVWPGGDRDVAEFALQAESWDEVLADEVSGELDLDGREFVWLTRYLGDKQLLYLTEAAPDREDDEDDGWFFGLF